jgi:hypothetical protein
MLTSLIDITPAAYRRGANQMRQQLVGALRHFAARAAKCSRDDGLPWLA